MSDSPWSKPDESGRSDVPDAASNPAAGADTPRSLGPPSTALPNVPDITPVAGIPLVGPASAPPEGTAVMPVVPTAPPTRPSFDAVASPHAGPGLPPGASVGGPRYVVAERVPWYRTPDGRNRAAVGAGLALLVLAAGIVWALTRESDDGDVLVTEESTTTFEGQFDANLDTTTTSDLVAVPIETSTSTSTSIVETTIESTTTLAPETTTTVPETTTTVPETTTTVPETTTTTLPPPPEVVVPRSTSTIGEIIQASPGLAELDALMTSVGFYAELNAITVPYTLFAPSNEAIGAVSASLPNDPEAVRDLLRRHVTLEGRFGSRELFQRTELEMLDGSTVPLVAVDLRVGGAPIVVADKGGADTDQVLHVVSAIVAA